MKYSITLIMLMGAFALSVTKIFSQEIDKVVISCQDIDINGNLLGLIIVRNGVTTVSDEQSNIVEKNGYLELSSKKCTVLSTDKNIPKIGCFGKLQLRLPENFWITVSSRKLAINISMADQKDIKTEYIIKVSVANLKYEEGGKIYRSNIESIKKIGGFAEALNSSRAPGAVPNNRH